MSPLLIATIVFTVLAAIAGAVYMSGAADDVVRPIMERYFKAEAKAEEKLLEKSGETYAEGFLYVPILTVFFYPVILSCRCVRGNGDEVES